MLVDERPSSGLSDGTAISDLFDGDSRRIHGRIYADPEIHRMELERIFCRSWCFVGFESEIPHAGDYVTRLLGADSVIVTREKTGRINVLLNACTHRGTQLSVTDRGTTKNFKCPYHGWVFDNGGRLTALVAQRERLANGPEKACFNLTTARVANYRGLLFANWDESAPEFTDYLGDARWYIDILFGSVDDQLATAGPPMRWTVPCNWKFGAENFAGDGYHTPTAHASAVDIGLIPPAAAMASTQAVAVADSNYGHGLIHLNLPNFMGGFQLEHDQLMQVAFPWLPPDVIPQMDHHLSDEQLRVIAQGEVPGIGTLFPNFSWVMQMTPAGPLPVVRTWNPIAPNMMEVWSWTVAHPKASEELRRASVLAHSRLFGASGVVEQDDLAVWSRIQRARNGVMGQRLQVDFSCTRVPDSSNYFADGSPWPGPGEIWQGFISDELMWNFYVRWRELVSAR
jgi:phenylpropionate dioxygenase-like ring-hydroxylating dioxygenase large terminal subunit